MARFVLALDQGTTGNTVLVIDDGANVVGRASNEFPQIFPRPGWVEHSPDDIWSGLQTTIGQALDNAGIAGSDVGAIGITNQRETTVIWDHAGIPIANAIVWQDRRTSDRCAELKSQGLEDMFKSSTGLVLDPYFSGTKVAWLLDNVDGARQKAEQGQLKFGTIDSFVLFKLTGGTVHATEPSNASRTLLYNINDGQWDHQLCKFLDVPTDVLPDVLPSSGVFGETRGLEILPDGIPVSGIAGDQQAALFGQACFSPGQSKCTYGTGAFLLLNTGDTAVQSNFGILTTVAWELPGQPLAYALEGSAFIAGAAVQWVRDGLEIIDSAPAIEDLAGSVPDADGVYFVPALSGLGAPHWNPDARGVIYGITRGTTRAHIARATLDGIAFQITDLIRAMDEDSPTPLAELRVDGGATANNLLMQTQADLLQIPVIRPQNIETTAFGAGFLAGLGAGIWDTTQAIIDNWKTDRVFEPEMSADEAAERLAGWQDAVAKA